MKWIPIYGAWFIYHVDRRKLHMDTMEDFLFDCWHGLWVMVPLAYIVLKLFM